VQRPLQQGGGKPNGKKRTQHNAPKPEGFARGREEQGSQKFHNHERTDHQSDGSAMMPVEGAELSRTDAGKARILDQLHEPNNSRHAESGRGLDSYYPRQRIGRGAHARREVS
jgi:hypothetical protein